MAGGPSKDAKALAARVNALDGFRAVLDGGGSHGGLSYTVQREVEGGKWKFVSHIPGHASYESLALVRAETALRSKGVPLPRLDKPQPKEKTVATVDVQGELRSKLKQLLVGRYGDDSEMLARDCAAVVAASDLEQFGGPHAKSSPRDVALQAIHSALSVGRDLGDKNVQRFTLCIERLSNGGPPPAESREVPSPPALRAQVKTALHDLAAGMGHYTDAEGAAQAHFSRRASARVEGAGEREGAVALYRFLALKQEPDPKWAAAFAAEANLAQVLPSADPANRMIAARGRKYVDEERMLREPSEALRERISQVLRDRDAFGFSRETKRSVSAARSRWAEEVAELLPDSPKHGPATRERVMAWVARFVQDPELLVADLATITSWNAALDKITGVAPVEDEVMLRLAEPAALRTVAADDDGDDDGSGVYDGQGVDLARPPKAEFDFGTAEESAVADMQEELEMYRELEKELRQEIADISGEKNALVDELAAAEATLASEREESEAALAESRSAVAVAERAVAEARLALAAAEARPVPVSEPTEDLRGKYAALLLRLAEAPEPMPEGREKVLDRLDRIVVDAG